MTKKGTGITEGDKQSAITEGEESTVQPQQRSKEKSEEDLLHSRIKTKAKVKQWACMSLGIHYRWSI